MLAQSEVYLGNPDGHLRTQQTIIDATPADLRDAAVEWLSRGALTVEVRPFPDYAAGESDEQSIRDLDLGPAGRRRCGCAAPRRRRQPRRGVRRG